MDDRNLGYLAGKFVVKRSDGSSEPGGKHADCKFFVLDLEHDRFAAPALRAYAEACDADYPLLAADILLVVDSLGPAKSIR